MPIQTTQRGVTLVELLIVIAIFAILASLAAPSFSELISRTRQDSVFSQLVSDLNRARNEAIKRNTSAILCVRGSDTACGNTTNWQNGWLVCVGSGITCNAVLAVHAPLSSELSLVTTVTSVQFHPDGSNASGATTLTLDGTFSGHQARQIKVAVTGNIAKL
ncbi:GspH/FimT family pseudopilin [Sideroxydans sp.]